MQKVLFSFSLIFDIEYGLYKHIMNEYDENYFKFKFKDDIYLKNIIMFRDKPNPLSKICTKLTKDNIDDIYEDIMKNEYDKVLENVISTDLIDYISILKGTNRYEPNILCKNKQEEQICKQNDLIPIYNIDNEWEIFSKEFYSLYFRYFDEIDITEIDGMNIYFSNTLYNIINKKQLISINNIIRFIDLYTIKKPI